MQDVYDSRARIVHEPAVIERAYGAPREQDGWQTRVSDFFSRLFGRYHARAIIELEVLSPA